MILAPNHQLPLSGNSFVLGLIIVLGLSMVSCSGTKKVVIKDEKKVQITKANEGKKKEQSVDTIKWKKIDEDYPFQEEATPKTIDKVKEKPKSPFKSENFKDVYNVSLLIPLNSNNYNQALLAKSRFVQFYAGALLALEELDAEGIKLNLKVIDTEQTGFNLNAQKLDILNENVDLIIGPFEKEDVKLMVDEAKQRQITLVSPWYTSTKLTNENPFYLQLKPNLKEHFFKMADHISSNFRKGEVVVLTKDNKEGNAWFNYFQECTKEIKKDENFLTQYYYSEDSLKAGNTAFFRLFESGKVKAVILPNYSYNDEDLIYSVIRRLSVDKGNNFVNLYGMPILHDSEKIDFEYYNSLKMRIVLTDYIDDTKYEIKNFKRKFLDNFGEIANADAIKGYDAMIFIGRNLNKYGRKFQFDITNQSIKLIQSNILLKKSNSDDTKYEDTSKFDYFENKHIDLIEFNGTRFVKIY